MGTRFGGRGLGGQQTVRGGRYRAEDRRVRVERPVARDRVEQQPDQPVGHRARSDAGLHVRGRRQSADPGQHGRQRDQADRHGRGVQGVRRGRGHNERAVVLVRLAVGLRGDGRLRWQRPTSDIARAAGAVAVAIGRVREQGVLVGRYQTGHTQRQQVRPDHRFVRVQEPGDQGPEICENRPLVGPERR